MHGYKKELDDSINNSEACRLAQDDLSTRSMVKLAVLAFATEAFYPGLDLNK